MRPDVQGATHGSRCAHTNFIKGEKESARNQKPSSSSSWPGWWPISRSHCASPVGPTGRHATWKKAQTSIRPGTPLPAQSPSRVLESQGSSLHWQGAPLAALVEPKAFRAQDNQTFGHLWTRASNPVVLCSTDGSTRGPSSLRGSISPLLLLL